MGTPLPRLFFSHLKRHTPLPARAAPALPAPAAIIRRAAGVQWSRALPRVSRHPRGGLAGWAGAGHPSSYHAASQVARRWCWGSILCSALHPGGCHHGAMWRGSMASAGETSLAELTQWELEKSHRFPIQGFVPSKRQAVLSN